MKKLKCHTTLEPYFTSGKVYDVEEESQAGYSINDDMGTNHGLSKDSEYDGLSYKSWFEEPFEEGNS